MLEIFLYITHMHALLYTIKGIETPLQAITSRIVLSFNRDTGHMRCYFAYRIDSGCDCNHQRTKSITKSRVNDHESYRERVIRHREIAQLVARRTHPRIFTPFSNVPR